MTYIKGVCELCGKEFEKLSRSKPYRFCSYHCGVRGRSGPTRLKPIKERTCQQCNQLFSPPSNSSTQKFCGRACWEQSIQGVGNGNYKNAGWMQCLACNKKFQSYDKNRKYCDFLCSRAAAETYAIRNQRKGYIGEKKCLAELASRGYSVARTAGSKGPFDVMAINENHILYVQVKKTKNWKGRCPSKAKKYFWKYKESLFMENTRVMIWAWIDGTGWFVTELFKDEKTKSDWGLDWIGLNVG